MYYDFAAPVTTGLNVYLTKTDGSNVAVDYSSGDIAAPPVPTATTTTSGEANNNTAGVDDSTEANTDGNEMTEADTTTAAAAAVDVPTSPGAQYTSSVKNTPVPSGYKKLVVFEVGNQSNYL